VRKWSVEGCPGTFHGALEILLWKSAPAPAAGPPPLSPRKRPVTPENRPGHTGPAQARFTDRGANSILTDMARLTDQEKQEIIRFLERDKPLPDKYRFLLFDDKREVELVWNGKTNEVCSIVLPFQTIEQVDEPRIEKSTTDDELAGGLFDSRGRQLTGWTNKLIWGDNKLILSSLKNGPLRDEIEKQGGLKLIYIDPPFDVGADFSMDIEVGDGGDTFTKRPNILEEIAYRDTWGQRGRLVHRHDLRTPHPHARPARGGWEYLCAYRAAGFAICPTGNERGIRRV